MNSVEIRRLSIAISDTIAENRSEGTYNGAHYTVSNMGSYIAVSVVMNDVAHNLSINTIDKLDRSLAIYRKLRAVTR